MITGGITAPPLSHLDAHMSRRGDLERADAALRHASWLDVNYGESLSLMALMRIRSNRLEDACRTQRRTVARQLDEPWQYLFLSKILEKMGRDTETRANCRPSRAMAAAAQTSAN
jgi:hypothetical protein